MNTVICCLISSEVEPQISNVVVFAGVILSFLTRVITARSGHVTVTAASMLENSSSRFLKMSTLALGGVGSVLAGGWVWFKWWGVV